MSRLSELFSCDINADNLPVRVEQIHARLRTYPLMISGQVIVALMLVALMWDKVAHPVLFVWVGVLFAELAAESFYAWREVADIHTQTECRRWRNRLLVSVTLASLIWGVGGVLLFVPNDLAYQALLICVFLGVGAGAATTNPVFPPALYIYISLLILPMVGVNALVGDHTHDLLAGLMLVYWIFLLNTGKDLGKTFELSLHRAIENEQLVEQLKTEKQRAEQANQMKSRFLAAASHDLRQPIHALSMLIEALKAHVPDAQGQALHGKVENSVEVLGGMLNALLDVSRLDAGVVQPHYEYFSLQPLLGRLREEFKVFADKQGLHLDVPDCAEEVFCDAILLELVLRNLLGNALRHTPQGEVALRCKLIAGGMELTVQDSGVGIAEEFMPHIFEEYFQVGNRQRDRRKGQGLGLSIVRRLEQLLGLGLQVSSTPGVGTRFVMVIPERKRGVGQ